MPGDKRGRKFLNFSEFSRPPPLSLVFPPKERLRPRKNHVMILPLSFSTDITRFEHIRPLRERIPMKKLLPLTLALALAIPSALPARAVSFPDVKETDWFYS